MSKNLTHSQIEKTLRKCQKRLRLQDWNIDLKVVRKGTFPDDRVAQCQFFYRNMSAVVSILDPRDNDDTGYGMQNVESTIYHELLHIILSPTWGADEPPSQDVQEQIIERLAKGYAGI
jgi:hypothetical protein